MCDKSVNVNNYVLVDLWASYILLEAEVAAPGLLYCARGSVQVNRFDRLPIFYQFSDHCILRPVQFVVAKCHNISMFTEKLFADRDRHNSL